MAKVYNWFQERLEIQAIADDISSKYVPPHVNIFYLSQPSPLPNVSTLFLSFFIHLLHFILFHFILFQYISLPLPLALSLSFSLSLSLSFSLYQSMTCADVVGFHAFDHARHFLNATKRMLGIRSHTTQGGTHGLFFIMTVIPIKN